MPSSPESVFAADCRMCLEVLNAWPEQPYQALRDLLHPERPFVLVAEGSSLLMPGAFLRSCARQWGWAGSIDAIGGREARRLDLSRRAVVCASNSGRSREVVEAMPGLPADAVALVGIPGGLLTRLPHLVLLPRPEQAVPATASVLATCLALGHALADACCQKVPLPALRRAVTEQLMSKPDFTGVQRVLWVGGSAGVTAELALKTMEATGLAGLDLPGSLGLHGIHEILADGDLVVAFDIDPADQDELRRRVEDAGARLHLPALPDLGAWTPLPALVHGWRVLAAIASSMGRDPAVPQRATKIGNPCPNP